jgi:Flp pilus assembly protein TadB
MASDDDQFSPPGLKESLDQWRAEQRFREQQQQAMQEAEEAAQAVGQERGRRDDERISREEQALELAKTSKTYIIASVVIAGFTALVALATLVVAIVTLMAH